MNSVLLVNIEASRAKRNLTKLKKLSDGKVIEIKDTADIKKYYDRALAMEPDLIIVAGGDGTIISCIDYCSNHGYRGVYGIIPLGTANYLARNLNIPMDIAKSFKTLKSGKPKKINLAEANGRLFSLITDLGITASVSEEVDNKVKRIFGQGAYLIEGFQQLFSHDAFDYEITLDNERVITGKSHEIVVFNGDVNLQLAVAPPGNLYQDSLRLTIYGNGDGIIKLLWYTFVYIITLGKVQKGIINYDVSTALIKTTPEKIYSSDGEVAGKTPIEVRLSETEAKIIH